MIAVPAGLRVLIATKPVDFRRGADGLAALVRETLGEDPFSGTIYVFHLKRADRVKMVAWDSTGLVLLWALKWPPITDGVMRLTSAQLAALVEVIPGKVGH
jgi:transposase